MTMTKSRHWKCVSWIPVCLFLGFSLALAGCGGGSSPATSARSSPGGGSAAADPCDPPPASLASPSGLPTIQEQHVFIVMEENTAYDAVMGNTQDMPYLNGLAKTYAYSEGYYADAHNSLPDYFMLTTGQLITTSDAYTGTVTAANVIQALNSMGRTWKAYVEGLPSAGYTGGDTGLYLKRHNPFAYFADVQSSSVTAGHMVPFTQLATDMANHNLPNYGFIVPNVADDAHSCADGSTTGCTYHQRLSRADSWLKAHIGPLLQDPDFNSPGHGLLIVTFDEAFGTQTTLGGGQVPWVAVGPDVKAGYVSAFCAQHQSTLRFMLELLGVTQYPGAAATAPSMRNFLVGN